MLAPHPRKEGILHTVRREVSLAAREKAGLDLNNDDEDADGDDDVVTVHLSVRAKTPIPFVRNVEEEDDVLEGLGPGLANVVHFLAVYSCKVRVECIICRNVGIYYLCLYRGFLTAFTSI